MPDQLIAETAAVAESLRGPLAPQRARRVGVLASTAQYLLRTDVHTFAFSVAANAILSFFPFVVLLMTVIRRVFHSRVMADVVAELLRDYLPAGQDFVIRNLNAMVNSRQRVQIFSLIILLVTSSGIFMPLEVALNRIWRFPNNRSYLGNQLISLGLAFSCGVLALLSVAMTAGNEALVRFVLRGHSTGFIAVVGFLMMKLFAIAASIAIFFLIYWLLPNGKVSWKAVVPTAILTGLLSEALKYGYILALPWLNFGEVYGPFFIVGEFDVLGILIGNAASGWGEPECRGTGARENMKNSRAGLLIHRHAGESDSSPSVDAADHIL